MYCYYFPWLVGLQPGGVEAMRNTATMFRMPNGWYASRRVDWGVRIWLPEWKTEPSSVAVLIPFWAPACLTLSASLTAWRLDVAAWRRIRAGTCARCGYDRTGLAAGTACPECGSKRAVG